MDKFLPAMPQQLANINELKDKIDLEKDRRARHELKGLLLDAEENWEALRRDMLSGNKVMSPTQLANKLVDSYGFKTKIHPHMVNQALIDMGLQTCVIVEKTGKPTKTYEITDRGVDQGIGVQQVDRILWAPDVVNILAEFFMGNGVE